MLSNTFQNGGYLELYNGKVKKNKITFIDKDLLKQWKFTEKTQKVFDNELKNYIHILKTGGISKMQIPQNEKLSLGLLQGYLIFQIYLNSTKSFTIQISISNSMNSKRRLLFTACSNEFVYYIVLKN